MTSALCKQRLRVWKPSRAWALSESSRGCPGTDVAIRDNAGIFDATGIIYGHALLLNILSTPDDIACCYHCTAFIVCTLTFHLRVKVRPTKDLRLNTPTAAFFNFTTTWQYIHICSAYFTSKKRCVYGGQAFSGTLWEGSTVPHCLWNILDLCVRAKSKSTRCFYSQGLNILCFNNCIHCHSISQMSFYNRRNKYNIINLDLWLSSQQQSQSSKGVGRSWKFHPSTKTKGRREVSFHWITTEKHFLHLSVTASSGHVKRYGHA